MTSIHIVAILYLVCLIVRLVDKITIKMYEIATIASILMGLVLQFSGFYSRLSNVLSAAFLAHAGIDTSAGAIIKRIALTIIVMYCFHNTQEDQNSTFIYKFVLTASMFYYLTIGVALMSGRAYALWGDLLEAVIIAKYATSGKVNRFVVATFIVALSTFILIKNINAEIYRSYYVNTVNAFNYPYCNIFQKELIDIFRSSHYYR